MNFTLNIKGRLVEYHKPIVMGIVNLTDDSFFAGSRVKQDQIIPYVSKMIDEGADWLDLGACSTRPGAIDVDPLAESTRITEAVMAIRREYPNIILSVDTYRAKVARDGLEAGADIINDVSGGEIEPEIHEVARDFSAPYILMHMQGTPQTMQHNPVYKNVTTEVLKYLLRKKNELNQFGIHDIIVDPGFGFGKTVEQNFQMLKELDHFKTLKAPILIGLSRKSMIYKPLKTSPEESLNATTALNMTALQKGASILRVHDVKEATELLTLQRYLE